MHRFYLIFIIVPIVFVNPVVEDEMKKIYQLQQSGNSGSAYFYLHKEIKKTYDKGNTEKGMNKQHVISNLNIPRTYQRMRLPRQAMQSGRNLDFETFCQTRIAIEKKAGQVKQAFIIPWQKYIDELQIKHNSQKYEQPLLALRNQSLKKDLRLKSRQILLNTLAGSSFTLILLLGLMIWFFFFKQKKEKKINEQVAKYRQKEKEVAAAHALVMGGEKERQRIAGELHDSLGVLLSSACIYFAKFEENEDLSNLVKAKELLNKANTELRRISHNMMPVVLNRFGLWAAMEDLTEELSDTGSISIILEGEKLARMPENTETIVFRIVQELLNNTLKYAEATQVVIKFKITNQTVFMEYQDNGKGFDLKKAVLEKGMGLTGIKSQLEFLKGSMNYTTSPGNGVDIFLSFPFIAT